MACGLPVVYSKSGGVPELVGEEAGVGVETEISWDALIPPDPGKMAHAVKTIMAGLDSYRSAARHRAEQMFSFANWVTRHRELFSRIGIAM